MIPQSAQSAADLIWIHWQEGTVLDHLPIPLRPETRAEGYAIQAWLSQRSSKGPIGWKIAATSLAGQGHIGVDGPIAGRLLKERCFQSGTVLNVGFNRMRVAEPEFAFRMGQDLEPRLAPYRLDEVMERVAGLHPALEVPDSRFSDVTRVGAAQLIAESACAHEFVLGSQTACDWRGLDLARHDVIARVGTKPEQTGSGANVLGDPRLALTWLANELSGRGVTLAAGEVVTTGTCMTPLAIEAGDEVRADFGVLGRVSASFR